MKDSRLIDGCSFMCLDDFISRANITETRLFVNNKHLENTLSVARLALKLWKQDDAHWPRAPLAISSMLRLSHHPP
jgi:hypothetical protein